MSTLADRCTSAALRATVPWQRVVIVSSIVILATSASCLARVDQRVARQS